jgi:ADP-L-glycero-D-manno-heptose 6-epimerase
MRQQLKTQDTVALFEGSDGYGPGCQERDFIHVNDVVSVNLWLLDHPQVSGIFNCGTGRAQSFNEVAQAVIAHHQRGQIEYIAFPEQLKGRYQSYTQADMAALRAAGYTQPFMSVEQGVASYMAWLQDRSL